LTFFGHADIKMIVSKIPIIATDQPIIAIFIASPLIRLVAKGVYHGI